MSGTEGVILEEAYCIYTTTVYKLIIQLNQFSFVPIPLLMYQPYCLYINAQVQPNNVVGNLSYVFELVRRYLVIIISKKTDNPREILKLWFFFRLFIRKTKPPLIETDTLLHISHLILHCIKWHCLIYKQWHSTILHLLE